jgi:hypothetical protein
LGGGGVSLLSSYALEQRLKALRYAHWAQYHATPIPEIAARVSADEKREMELNMREMGELAANTLSMGETYYVRKGPIEMITAEAATLDIRNITCHPNLVEPAGFMWFEMSPLKITYIGSAAEEKIHNFVGFNLCAISWCWSNNINLRARNKLSQRGLVVLGYEEFPNEPHIVETRISAVILENESFDYKHQITENVNLASFLLAASAFMRQKIVMNTPERANRQMQKRLQKTGEWGGSTIIRDIQLRAIEQKARSTAGLTQTDYSCRWWVRRHWRLQHYPSTGKVIPILIDPYIKGPLDKPIKDPSTPIFVVTR